MRARLPSDGRAGRFSSSLGTGLAILRCFTAERPVLGIADIADELGLSRSTTHRYMATLVELGRLEQGASSKYLLAPAAADVGAAALDAHPLRRSAEDTRKVLEELRKRTGFTVSVGVLVDGDVLYLERLRGGGKGQREIDLGVLGLRVGCRLPAQCTAMGKVLLAGLPEPERSKRITALKPTRKGPRSITAKGALREELAAIERAGFALSDRELSPVLLSVAAPVKDDTGTVLAAVAVEAHTATTTPEALLRDAAPHLIAATVRLGASLPPSAESAGADTAPRRAPADGTQT
jgi:IclR family transcriptional regulator, pca regulon regulatory protein